MRAGELRQRIDILGPTASTGENGEPIDTYGVLFTGVPASIIPLSGSEFVQAGGTSAKVTTRVRIRAMGGIPDTGQVKHTDRYGAVHTYEIRANLSDPTFARHILLMCEEVRSA